MKLKQFDRTTTGTRPMPTGEPAVSIKKSGSIHFNKVASALIGLEKGNHVLILQDQENPADWYVTKTDDKNGFETRDFVGQMAFSCMAVVREIWKSHGIKDPQTTLLKIRKQPFMVNREPYYMIYKNGSNPIEKL